MAVINLGKFVIMADGKYENIFYTGREGKYWCSNIMRSKIYNERHFAERTASKFVHNNARVVEVLVKEDNDDTGAETGKV